jgi:transcription antitermination factor NusA-like protein
MVDPHGNLIDAALANIILYAPERVKDVLLLDFGDPEHFIAFNPLDIQSRDQIEPAVDAVMEIFLAKNVLNLLEAPRARPLLQQALWALCEANVEISNLSASGLKNTLLEIPVFFHDNEFRQLIMECCKNPTVQQRFAEGGTFDQQSPKARVESTSPITTRFDQLSTGPAFANVFGQSRNKLDYLDFILKNKIILLKFPKYGGRSKAVSLISGLTMPLLLGMMNKFADADKAVYLLVDEFQNYASESYKVILEEARKFGLHTIATSQNPTRLDSDIQSAVYANARTKLTFQLDKLNVGRMAASIGGDSDALKPENVTALPSYYGYANLMQQGGPSGPFTFKALPPLSENLPPEIQKKVDDEVRNIEVNSRNMLATPMSEVEGQRSTRVEEIKALLAERLRSQVRAEGGNWDNKPRVQGVGAALPEPKEDDDSFDW